MAQRAYLDERVRTDGTVGYRVRWRLGGVGRFQTETFVVKRKAERFLLDVEDAGVRWPKHWVKGFDYVIPGADAGGAHLFEGVANLYLNTRTRVQPDTLARYRVQVRALAEHFPISRTSTTRPSPRGSRPCNGPAGPPVAWNLPFVRPIT